jgi:hypothetical protein
LRYLHFTNWTNLSDANVGQRTGTGWKVSNYWQRKFERHQGLVSALRDDGAVDLMAFMKVAREAGELIKEYVFEEIRADEFPDKPSRRRCMFLLPPKVDPETAAAYLNFKATHYGLIEIEPIGGVFHHAKMDLLKCSGGDYATMAARAREYWTEIAADDDPSGEVLFFGDFTITRIIRPRAATE